MAGKPSFGKSSRIQDMAALQRLAVLQRHIKTAACSGSNPSITVTPSSALVDQKVDIVLKGLTPGGMVTVVATVQENNAKFESQAVYKANERGMVHNGSSPSIAGTYTGIKPMGLFWSVVPKVGQRLFKKDVETPLKYEMKVYNGQLLTEMDSVQQKPVASKIVDRWFKKSSVRRIPLVNEQFKGTIFLPEGPGPFPAIVDLYGGLVKLVESRAALLASHGYATFALCYLYSEGLPQKFSENPLEHVKQATEWFYQQPYVDKERFGMLGLCYGGYLSLGTTSLLPQVRTLVNISGLPIYAGHTIWETADEDGSPWPDGYKVRMTEAGLVIKDIWKCSHPKPIPAWQHGAKILQICALDDQQVDPKWHRFSSEKVPEEFKANHRQLFYPRAGHIIDPPYTPHCSYIISSKERMQSLDFMPKEVQNVVLLTGGNPVDHAAVQEDAWTQILDFLEQNLKCSKNYPESSTVSGS